MILGSVFASAAQDACGTNLRDAPALLGLRLGMPVAEVQSVFGRDLKVKVKTKGARSFFQNYPNEPAKGALAGVGALYLRFDEGLLYQIEVFYADGGKFATLGNLTSNFAAANNFPASLWRTRFGKAEIDCGNYSVRADAILNPHLEITDETVRARVEAAQKKQK